MAEFSQNGHGISKDDVISKLKDDGDFDRLRLKIIRKLKDDEVLRENLRSIVRESTALNRLGAENMKPRQLSDAIYQEVGEHLTAQISDGLWGIIRSSDGMNSEIVETVQSVYNRVMSAKGIPTTVLVQKEGGSDFMGPASRTTETDHKMSDGSEPNEPPGFSLPLAKNNFVDSQTSFRPEKRPVDEQQQECPRMLHDNRVHNGTSAVNKNPDDCSDEDPELPPGFG